MFNITKVYTRHTTFKKYDILHQKRVMRGNDVVLKLHEKLHQVLIMLQIELLTQPVTPDFDAS